MEKLLVSVAVLSYNNYRYIKDCVRSILQQDYPRIQLIISDDSSSDFDAEEISRYIEEHKQENLESVTVHRIDKNGGTSKNFNYALSLARGKYVKFIAADDLFYDKASLSLLVSTAESCGNNVVIARAPNYDMYLEQQEWTYPSDENWKRMTTAGQKEFFGMMSEYCLISAPSTLYNREFLVGHGGADESYRLIEDWPFWMKMIRAGEPFTFLNQPTVIYRSGGISNGKNHAVYSVHQIEYADVIKKECLPYRNMFANKRQYRKAKQSERRHRCDGLKQLHWSEYGILQKLLFILAFFSVYWNTLLEVIIRPTFSVLERSKRNIMVCGVIFASLAILVDVRRLLEPVFGSAFAGAAASVIQNSLAILGIFLFALSVMLGVISVSAKFFRSILHSA